jgi:hypothetical protein
MLADPRGYRRNALSCMQLSETARSHETRDHFARLARTWLRLAGDQETSQALIDLLDDFEPQPERRAG